MATSFNAHAADHLDPLNETNITLYQSIIGCLLYLALGSRPDVSYAVGILCKYTAHPREIHMKAAIRVIRYLKGTINSYLLYTSTDTVGLQGYFDASPADDRNDRHSTEGYVFLLDKNPISWTSKKQSICAQSSTEAEYIQGSLACRELMWIHNLLDAIKYNVPKPAQLFMDNRGAIALTNNGGYSQETKHIATKHRLITTTVADGRATIRYIHTTDNPADVLTKPLPNAQHCNLIKLMNMISTTTDNHHCGVCREKFTSKSAMHKHIRQFNHFT